jgi:hypothetical protein
LCRKVESGGNCRRSVLSMGTFGPKLGGDDVSVGQMEKEVEESAPHAAQAGLPGRKREVCGCTQSRLALQLNFDMRKKGLSGPRVRGVLKLYLDKGKASEVLLSSSLMADGVSVDGMRCG